MGCVSSKLHRKDLQQDLVINNINYTNHVVSLTSSTLGVLKLEEESLKQQQQQPIKEQKRSPPRISVKKSPKKVMEELEVINAWELMSDLEEEMGVSISTPLKKSPKSQVLSGLNPSRFFNSMYSPKKPRGLLGWTGKENKNGGRFAFTPSPNPSPKQVLKPVNSCLKSQTRSLPAGLKIPLRSSPDVVNSFRGDSRQLSSRRSLSPLFDPKLIECIEREHKGEVVEQIKKMVSPQRKSLMERNADSTLDLYEKKCPPTGEKRVVIYTTTLRGIRKTFEDCNVARAVLESHQIQFCERDISMDSGYREELRVLMGRKDVRVPLVFVKGRLIGGVDELSKLEEEGKLGSLLHGIPSAITAGCEGCGTARFVMCVDCNGSCKVLDEVEQKMVKCKKCNENGLVQCPICC